jgi:hypothetical protein
MLIHQEEKAMKPLRFMVGKWATYIALSALVTGLGLAMAQQGMAETSIVGARQAGNNGLASYQAQRAFYNDPSGLPPISHGMSGRDSC